MSTNLDACKASCDFSIDGDNGACAAGGGSCAVAEVLEAEASGFHDAPLIEATQQIRAILAAIPPDPAGRKLSFLRTRMGEMLAWLDHSGGEVSANAVTAKDDDETVARALKLKSRPATAGAAQA